MPDNDAAWLDLNGRVLLAGVVIGAAAGATLGLGVQIPAVRSACTRAWESPHVRRAIVSLFDVEGSQAVAS